LIKQVPDQQRQWLLLLEATLYASGKPMDTKTLGSFIGLKSQDTIRELLRILAQRYREYNGSLEIIELERDRFVFQLKPQYVPTVQRFSIKPSLTRGPLTTLAYIAYNQPIAQSKVVAVRGSHAYRHIRLLEAQSLISTQELGKTKILRVTDDFLDHFNLSRNQTLMRRQLRALFKTQLDERRLD
jgi:segregation and condensation protein B